MEGDRGAGSLQKPGTEEAERRIPKVMGSRTNRNNKSPRDIMPATVVPPHRVQNILQSLKI